MAPTGRGDLVSVLLAFAVLVLVPLGLPLVTSSPPPAAALAVASVSAGVSLVLGRGGAVALLAVPWLVLTAGLAVRDGVGWLRRSRRVDELPGAVALGFLAVGAAWLVADRAALEPAGFAPPFVALTAVHFHHAGFVATTVLGTCLDAGGRAQRVATALVVAGPPVVAVGFLAVPALQVLGALLLSVGLWTFAAVVWVRPLSGGAGVLLRVAGLAVVLPMVLALHWATGAATGWFRPLDIPTMAQSHGVVQAFGFGLLGLLGRRVAAARQDV